MAGLTAVFDALIEVLLRTFGPFVIPATIFVFGLVGYGVLLFLNRRFRTRL